MRVLVVLGNKLSDDGGISDALEGRLKKVLEVAADFDEILLSGGAANLKAGISEARVMKEFLLNAGVDGKKLLLEDLSMTTKQNAQFCAPFIDKLGVNEITVLSSASHIRRWYLNPVKLFRHYTGCNIETIEA